MNKEKFEVVRHNWNSLAPKIGHSVNKLIFKVKDTGRGKFEEMECSRDSIGKVCFMDTFEKKHFPDFFYQIGRDGYLSHAEIDSLESILPRFMNY
jgi:hypothetical protein